MLKIGELKLKSNLLLAPLAGVSDLPFRLLNRKFGCGLAFVEMINARSLSHKSIRTRHMLASSAKDRPLGIQLLAGEGKFLLKALDLLSGYEFDLLDFNAACPAKKVVRRGEGVSLLKEPGKLQSLLRLLVKNSKFPVTVKIRTGWDKDSLNASEVALAAEEAGVKGLFIHGRTGLQGHGGDVDYRVISEVKKVLSIPLIASGDLLSPQLIKMMFDETGCDGVAIARGCLGNPWLFRETQRFLKDGKEARRPGVDEILKIMLEHLRACLDFYGEGNGVVIFRKFFSWYTRGFRKVRPFREKSSRVKTKEEMEDIIQSCCRLNSPFNSR